MTTLGIVSDTHVNLGGKRQLAPQLFDALQGVDLILHAGDLNTLRVVTDLEAIAPVYAVHGNNEDWEAAQLPRTRLIEVEGCRIGLAHGDVAATEDVTPLSGIPAEKYGWAAAIALSHFATAPLDCLVFGHSHWPLIHPYTRRFDGRHILLFNPGSAGKKRKSSHHSCGLLRVTGTQLDAQLITWD